MELHSNGDFKSIDRAHNGSDPDYDVVVIGGGPAGSTVATQLSRWGQRVLILEKECFPRHHIGESLLAGTTTLMKQLGVYDKVEQAGFVHKFGATYIWGKSKEPWSIFFSEVSDESRYSFQVDRAQFDKILLDHSREIGTTVLEQCRVTALIRDGERVVGVEYLDSTQEQHSVTARFIVDASGQSALFGTSMKLRSFNKTLRNFALYTYYQGGKSAVELVPGLRPQDKGNIFVVAIEKGWIWYIPLGNDRYSVGVVTHASLAKELSKENRFQFYQACLDSAPQIRYLLSDAQIESTSLYSQSDWSYVCDSFKGPGYLLVGDAACFVDPILSTGVDLAMEGAFKAAITINTLLNKPYLTEQALQWYEQEYKLKAGYFIQMAEHWYHGHRSQDDWFWKAKHMVDPNSNLSIRQAFILLTGGFTTGSGNEDLPALKSFGGFRPFQLRTIYANLENSIEGTAIKTEARTHTQVEPTLKLGGDVIENMGESRPRFKTNMQYCLSMLEQDNYLVPIVQINQAIEGVLLMRLALPVASLPFLEKIDGERSIRDIENEIAIPGDHEKGQGSISRENIHSIFQELYDQSIIEIW